MIATFLIPLSCHISYVAGGQGAVAGAGGVLPSNQASHNSQVISG